MQQKRHEHRRADHLAPHMAARELHAAVAAPPAGGEIAHDRNEVPRAEHMAARVAVRPPAQHTLAMHHAPRHAVQEARHTRAENGGEHAAVYGEEGGEMEHRKISPWKKSFVGDGRRPSATPLFFTSQTRDKPSAETAHPRRKGAFPRRSMRSGVGSEREIRYIVTEQGHR